MALLSHLADTARSPGDPTVIATGPSSRGLSDNAGKQLGWLSWGLGLTELFAAGPLARALGMEGQEALIRAYGVREIGAGMLCLSQEAQTGVWSRVAGDALDIVTLLTAYHDRNPQKRNVELALLAVAGITLLDLVTAQTLTVRHSRSRGAHRDYSDRSGFPGGASAARGLASDFEIPADMRTEPMAAYASSTSGRTSPPSDVPEVGRDAESSALD